ncbi:hypothetical protein Bca101_009701 [Brassica carinata]
MHLYAVKRYASDCYCCDIWVEGDQSITKDITGHMKKNNIYLVKWDLRTHQIHHQVNVHVREVVVVWLVWLTNVAGEAEKLAQEPSNLTKDRPSDVQ